MVCPRTPLGIMHTTHLFLGSSLILLSLVGWAAADLPRKAPLTKYRTLWQDSPFTSKPVEAGGPAVANLLDDYSLAGISPIEGGYRVTVMNKKKPGERIYVYSDEPDAKHGFRIEAVEKNEGGPRATVVRMSAHGQRGTLAYDESLLALAAAPRPPAAHVPASGQERVISSEEAMLAESASSNPNPAATRQPGGAGPQNPSQGAPRIPRPRVIGPPPSSQARPADLRQRPDRR